MAQFPLIQGSYQARGVIANAQACINLVPEPNPKDAPFPVTHYPAPGLAVLADMSSVGAGGVRGLYVTSTGAVIFVVGTYVGHLVLQPLSAINLGNLPSNSGNPVSMSDNGTTLVIVDGTSGGWQVPLSSLGTASSMTAITDPAFYGSTHVDFIDTFLTFNWPGTPTFYTTTSNAVEPFNPLYFAGKVGYNDRLVTHACLHDNIWLLGNVTTEVWFNSGAPDFPFQRMPNSIIQQGCVAPYSRVISDNALYWLSQDRWGHAMMMRGEGYTARRVSNYAVENIWAGYGAPISTIGMSYQIAGHETVGWLFPEGNAWWAYDASSGMWHQRKLGTSGDAWLPYCTAFAGWVAWVQGNPPYMLAGDRTTGRILMIDQNTYTDVGQPIARTRAWPHAIADGKRQHYSRFSAAFDGSALQPDTVNMDWSDDGGHTFGTPLPQTAANATNGQYQWRRLGYGRDRVFRLSWQGGGECALNGAWLDAVPMGT